MGRIGVWNFNRKREAGVTSATSLGRGRRSVALPFSFAIGWLDCEVLLSLHVAFSTTLSVGAGSN
jgi:hypothetical protein